MKKTLFCLTLIIIMISGCKQTKNEKNDAVICKENREAPDFSKGVMDEKILWYLGRLGDVQLSPDGRLFLLQNFGISEFHPVTGNKIPLARPKPVLSVGGAVESGYLYYASGSRFIRWKIPAPLK